MIPTALLLWLTVAAPSSTGCLPVETDRIVARDLAAALPAFGTLAPDTPLSYAPAPGSRRVFRTAELERLAARHGLSSAGLTDICFSRPTDLLTADRLLAAMHAAPGFSDARIEILEFSRTPVPRGEIEFRREGMVGSESTNGVLWKGCVRYGASHRFAIWARAKISVTLARVVAAENLPQGACITSSQVRLEEYAGLMPRQGLAQSLDQVVGRVLRRSVTSGAPIYLQQLDEVKDIGKGDEVTIHVSSGSARMTFVGRAETAGRVGENISVRNVSSGRTFRARVEAKGAATVIAGGTK